MQRMKCCDVFDWLGWSHATISPDLCWMTPLAFRVGLTANRCSLEFLGYMAALATSLSFPCMESSCLAIFCKDFWQKKTVLLFVIYSFWCWSGCCRYCNATAVWIWICDLQFVGKCWKLLPWQWLFQTSGERATVIIWWTAWRVWYIVGITISRFIWFIRYILVELKNNKYWLLRKKTISFIKEYWQKTSTANNVYR